jgi:hypothetical protein
MPIPQPWFRTPEDYEAIRHLVTDEPQLFDTFEEWLDAADKRFEKFIAKALPSKRVRRSTRVHGLLQHNERRSQ